ncbi:MAG: PAS domain-containing protein [Catenulispora sp.]|nr:PAS domain-containing protein [Catenulispora sp.]
MDRSPVRGVARLAAILDALPEALLLVDAGGRVVNANAVAVGWFEAPGVPLVGRPVTELLSGFGTALARVPAVEPTAGVWTEPGDSGAGRGGEDVGVPTRMVAKLADGTGFPAEVVRSFLPAMHGGLEVVVVRDVSGVADAEQELRRQQRQTELILRAASEGIVGVDTAGRVVLVNPAAARILKYRASELGGLEFDALLTGIAPGEPSPVADTLRTGRKHRLGSEAGLQLTAKGGAVVPVELSTAPVLEGETLVGAVVTFVDLARFRFPALAAPAAAPGGGLGTAAGDGGSSGSGISAESVGALRRPLEAARSELARLAVSGDALTASARHQLAHVTAELAEAARLVDELLDVAAGPSGLRKRPAELGRIVHAATDAATDLAGTAGIDLAVHTGPAEVVIDAERMTQAVRHLLVDTVQASPRGSTVVVAAARRGPIARIEVRGAEIGGVPEHLGFARTVVERHGGQLTVHRVEGKGVTYVIELPVGPEGENELAAGGPAAARNLVEETRIIPVVRELDAPETGSAHSGRRRLEVAAAVATTTTIPRQAAPSASGEPGWFATPVPAQAQIPSASTSTSGTTVTNGSTGSSSSTSADTTPQVEPRGRRRAAQHGTGEYLIQHVEPSAPYEPDAPLRTSGSYQEEAALASSGNYTPEAQQAGSLYGESLFRDPVPFGTDDGLPLFRDEVPAAGGQAGGARHGGAHGALGTHSAEPQNTASTNGFGGAFGSQPAQPAPTTGFGTVFGSEPQNSQSFANQPPFMSEQQTPAFPAEQQTPAFLPEQQAPPFMTEAEQPSPFAVEQQRPAPFAEPQLPSPYTPDTSTPAIGAGPNAWPNPAQPDPQPALTAWPPPDAPEPTAPPTLLVWPTPEPGTEQLLVQHGYAPTALKAPSQLQETGPDRPVALLADPVGVPVTRAALHTLRAAAADSGIPLFVTAGLGAVPAASIAATARRGADPSALLRALTPEQVASPRVLLLEENPDLAAAFAISLERDGMRVVQAATENDAMSALSAEHPQLVVMNLTLIRRRRSGVVEWLRAYERLHLAPTVLYTVPAAMLADTDLLHALRSGAAAVHLTDREVGPETANRLLDLMGKVAD